MGTNMEERSGQRWRFFRAGGFDQVRLESADDFCHLQELDQKLWVALACPVHGLEFDERTLALIDTDGDGRIRVPEILAATRWTCSLLKNPGDLAERLVSLPLVAINDASEAGKAILASARQVLSDLGKADTSSITVDDVADTNRIFKLTRFNGDGIIPVSAAEDKTVQTIITEIIDCLSAVQDRSGLPGIDAERINKFFAAISAYIGWRNKAESDATVILPLGEGTISALATLHKVRAKVEDYFTRCRLAAYDSRAAAPLSRDQAAYAAMAAEDLSGSAVETIAALPLVMVEAGRPLPLKTGINPAWEEALNRLRLEVITPFFGDCISLTETQWREILKRLAPCEAWLAAKEGAEIEKLGLARIREIDGSNLKESVDSLLARDKALAPQFSAITEVERLVRYYRDLAALLNNFVSFRDFYSHKEKAVFQAGTLYIDGRHCELCLRVEDTAKHSGLAGAGRIFIVYCDCMRKGTDDKMTIAAAFTAGDAGFLITGRNGIFYDRQGRDWDATITKIVEHPISIREAFWLPYRQIGKLIGGQIEKFATAREKAVMDKAAATTADVAAKPAADKPATAGPAAFDVAKFAGIFAAIGLAIGAIASAVASVVAGFLQLSWWQMPLAIGGAMLIASGPSMLIAFLKLRDRNLGPLLDACGWAINTRAKINIPFGTSLTSLARLPEGAERSLTDPYAEKERPWKVYAILVVIVFILLFLWQHGAFGWLFAK